MLTQQAIKSHQIAANKLEIIKNKAFTLIKSRLGEITEYEVQQFILKEFKKEKLICDPPKPIVASNKNTAYVHYFPSKKSAVIKKDQLIMIDIWAKLNKKDALFADITWMGYSGQKIPSEIQKIFNLVINARDMAVKYIKSELKEKRFPRARQVDKSAREYFKKFSLDQYFLHRTGHSLGSTTCHGKVFRLAKNSKKSIPPNVPFTIEPGLYFKNKFGVRSEIDCFITKDYQLKVSSSVQKRLVKFSNNL